MLWMFLGRGRKEASYGGEVLKCVVWRLKNMKALLGPILSFQNPSAHITLLWNVLFSWSSNLIVVHLHRKDIHSHVCACVWMTKRDNPSTSKMDRYIHIYSAWAARCPRAPHPDPPRVVSYCSDAVWMRFYMLPKIHRDIFMWRPFWKTCHLYGH